MKPTRVRFGILALITLATMLNYVDRSVMGVAQPAIAKELAITPQVMGLIFSAFSWTYALAQLPGGLLLDKLGSRLTYALSLGLWSLATMVHGLMTSVVGLFSARLALGLAEAPCFPANSRILSTWFPQTERARANGVYSVGQYIGLGFMIPVLTWISVQFGWRALFYLFGGAGVLFALVWYALYREPHESRRANQAELDHIAAGGGLGSQQAKFSFSWAKVRALLGRRQILGASIGQFCGNSTLVFFLTWFPSYLATERGMDWIKSGFAASLPYIAASVGVLLGGVISDGIIRRTGSATLGRKLPIIAGLLLTSTMVLANFVDSNAAVIAIMSVAFFGQGMVNLGWTLISDVAPKQMIGLTGGVFNFCANLAGIVTPLVVGFVVGSTGSFYGALAYIATLGLVGAAAYVFIVGEVKRVEIDA
ncbi:MAG: MFS transporter [Proteobacteria bacterium]|jgi:MFS transporter, ACS family, D-galactonate transporter|nr:MFS transporter [Pseudomonadota bacterium]MBK7117506.1 MFS transporter [Pseudomonadota bacterium]MBK9251274.1 MFS transporter [Pseudomonadota bacterium]MCC6632725.1 MFS transporter [Gammaproteobacteria bacterium]